MSYQKNGLFGGVRDLMILFRFRFIEQPLIAGKVRPALRNRTWI